MRLAVVGPPGVGKSTSMERYRTYAMGGAGTQPLPALVEGTVGYGDACLVLFNVTDESTFSHHADAWLEAATHFTPHVVLVATHMDVVDADPGRRQVPYADAANLAFRYGVMYIETAVTILGSAKAPYDAVLALASRSPCRSLSPTPSSAGPPPEHKCVLQ
jgi:hypothetical protein